MQKPNFNQVAIIVGAGPAGLTTAFELLARTKIKPIVIEKSEYMGGIARTVNYKGNRIDIGGHRFFSKSDRVMDWWLARLPLEAAGTGEQISYQGSKRSVNGHAQGPDPDKEDRVMLLRKRKSRLYYMRKLFDYPISLQLDTLLKLGPIRTVRIGLSYIKSVLFPIKSESNLEQFFINRFGKELYLTFFKDYTEKVWGVSCRDISAEWGAQRIKGLSITKAILHALKKLTPSSSDIRQKNTETSLIEQFMYPKLGPGQLWELVAEQIKTQGGEILTSYEVNGFNEVNGKITSLEAVNTTTGERKTFEGDYFFSTMPIKDLIRSLRTEVPADVREISEGLSYRDFMTVGLLVNKLKITESSEAGQKLISDNWIYIQEPDVLIGRLQIFNNWSPYLVSDPNKVWLGLEYFCNETDDIWNSPDDKVVALAAAELNKIGIIDKDAVLDATVLRMPKTYPGYFGTYSRFKELQQYLDHFENLYLLGRNGMHKYNNQDHAMLTAMVAVDNIVDGIKSKENIWSVNTELEYLEEKTSETS